MRHIFISIIIMLCVVSAAWAQYPTVTATVTKTVDSVIYTYRLTNTTAYDIWGFGILMPGGASGAIVSRTTSQDKWSFFSRQTSFDLISWDGDGLNVIEPGNSADFSITTRAGVPTTYNYTRPGSVSNWNWRICGDGGTGNIIIPVPTLIPEPSGLFALLGGVAGLGGIAWRRRHV